MISKITLKLHKKETFECEGHSPVEEIRRALRRPKPPSFLTNTDTLVFVYTSLLPSKYTWNLKMSYTKPIPFLFDERV
jgi:hypothetical protein